MKKSILVIIASMLVLVLVAGCAPTHKPMADATEEDMTEEADMTEENDMVEEAGMVVEGADADVADMVVEEDMTEEADMAEEEEIMGVLMEAGYIDLTPQEAKKLIDTTPVLVIVDVSPLYADGHLPGAVNHYIGDGSLDAAIPTLDKSKPYLVYCHFDSASIPGATKLAEAGFDPVYRLIGNYSAWVEAGFDVEK